jgi:hypothetical protein
MCLFLEEMAESNAAKLQPRPHLGHCCFVCFLYFLLLPRELLQHFSFHGINRELNSCPSFLVWNSIACSRRLDWDKLQ